MYKVIRSFLFLFNPEAIHHFIISFIKLLYKIPLLPKFFRLLYTYDSPDLKKTVFGIEFKNPVGLAAGFDKNADIFNEFSNLGFGFIEIGTVTPLGQPGNAKPRLFRIEKDRALINRMGFNNNGALNAVKKLKKRRSDLIIGGNIGKNTSTPNDKALEDYLFTFEKLYDYVDYFVVNVSCPNISDLHKLQDQESLTNILQTLTSKRNSYNKQKPILLKISPDLNFKQIDETLEIIKKIGIDGVVAANTTIKRDNLKTQADRIEKIGNGGLSGKPIKDTSTSVIRYISKKTNGQLPIIGVGGIMSPNDAKEKLDAGAHLIQVYTGFIYEGPAMIKRINKHLAKS